VAGADDGHLQSGRPPPVKKPTTASGSRFFKRKLKNVPFDLPVVRFDSALVHRVEKSVKENRCLNEPTTDRPNARLGRTPGTAIRARGGEVRASTSAHRAARRTRREAKLARSSRLARR
jgi:hypothetical protein